MKHFRYLDVNFTIFKGRKLQYITVCVHSMALVKQGALFEPPRVAALKPQKVLEESLNAEHDNSYSNGFKENASDKKIYIF